MSTPTRQKSVLEEEIAGLRARVNELETQLRAAGSPHSQTAEAVHQQKDWLRVTLTSIGDAVLATDTAGMITFLNPVAARLTGWPPEEALGRPVREIFRIVDENTHDETRDIVGQVLLEGCIVSLANHTALVARDGREIPIEDSAAPIRDLAGNIAGVVLVFHDVTEKRQAQEALQESERRVRLKLKSILAPEANIGNLELGDIVDTEAIQSLLNDFYMLTPIPMSMIDVKGEVLVGVGWQDICTKFHRAHPESCRNCIESDTQLSSGVPPGECRLYKCKNKMWDIATPITIGGQHVGNIFSGQFFFDDEPLDYELFKSQARKYGFDQGEYLAALERVPRLSKAAVETGMSFFMKLGHVLSQLSYSNIKLANLVAERDALADSLSESAELLKRAQQIARLGSWELDVINNRLSWSDEVYRIFGLEPHEFTASYEAFLEAVHESDRAAVDAAYSGSLREGRDSYEITHRVVSKCSGKLRWVHEKCEHVRDQTGRIVRSIGMVQDITERKRAEEQIRHHNAVLEGISRIFREAFTCDTEEDLGRACLAVVEDVTGSKFGFIGDLNAQGRLDVIAISGPGWDACRLSTDFAVHGIYGHVLLDERSFYTNDPASHPARIGTPEGHPPVKAFLGVPTKHHGKTIGMVAVGNKDGGYGPQDVDAVEALAEAIVQVLMRIRADDAVRAGEDRLRESQKLESIGVLAGGIAHDFNNLLTSILGNASLLQMDAPAGNGTEIKAIIEASEKAASLTHQLLAYAGKGQFKITEFDVSRLVRSSADLLRVSIPKSVEVQMDVPRTLPVVRGDSSQIQQVVMNLVINAAEAIEDHKCGSVKIAASVRDLDAHSVRRIGASITPGRYIEIAVRDNGCGMDEETRAKIFDPFFTTKFTGRGLGLAAVQGILRSHEGTITVESRPCHGSTFTVYLPCSKPRAAASGGKDAIVVGGRVATVLVVDDEEPVRAFTKAALERLGHRAVLAENGRQALELLCSPSEIDLVLLDIVMPVVGGVEAFSEIRKKWPTLAVLIASGYSRQEAQRLGIPDEVPFIEKPYTMPRLAAAIEKALGKRPGRKQLTVT